MVSDFCFQRLQTNKLFYRLNPVGLDSEKRIFNEKMRKERKKRRKEAKLMPQSQSYGHIRDRFRMILYFCY